MGWFKKAKRAVQIKQHKDQKFCFRCGFLMTPAHDEQHRVGYDVDTGHANIIPYKIRGWNLQYCTKDNVYVYKDKNDEWRNGYDLMEILHLIV